MNNKYECFAVRHREMSLIPETNAKIQQLNNVDKFILLLLGAKNYEYVPGPLHLQKEMFLLQNLFTKLADDTDYEPYFLGPHSEIVADEVEQLASSNLIMAEAKKLELTLEGKQIFDVLRTKSSSKEIQKIEKFKELLNDMTHDELLAFTYFSYPSPEELEKESVEYKYLLPRRKQLALTLYQKNKISAQKAAQIAGEYLEDFIEELKNVK